MSNDLNKKVKVLSGPDVSDARARVKYERENWYWLDKSDAIAGLALAALDEQGLSKEDLAGRMNVSHEQVTKIVKGNENLTLETIGKLEIALGIEIISNEALITEAEKRDEKARRAKKG